MAERTPIQSDLVKEFVMVSHGRLDAVMELLAKESGLLRSSVDWGEGDWECGLEAAGHVGNRDIARVLLDHGAPMTVFCAAMLGDKDLVEAFASTDPDVAHRPGVHGISLIYHVAISGNVEMAQLFVSPPGCNQAIHSAVRFGHMSMLDWLFDNGVDNPNILNFQNQTPLKAALEGGNDEIATMLRERGAHE